MPIKTDGPTILTDKSTGEVVSMFYEPVVITARLPEAYEDAARYARSGTKDDAEQRRKHRIANSSYQKFGRFIWTIYDTAMTLFPEIKPHTLTRLMFLSTYMDYNGFLADARGHRLTRKEISCLLNIGDTSFKAFLKEVKQYGAIIEADDSFRMNRDMFIKGQVTEKKRNFLFAQDKSITRLYIDGVRALYRQAVGTSSQRLSYIFRLMPYVNKEYNIICSNPLEHTKKKISPLSVGDVAEIVGYGRSNSKKFQDLLLEPMFEVDGSLTRAVRYVSGDELGIEHHCLFINPLVYYGGSRHEEVSILGQFK